jgi:hypothetical protein
MLRKKKKKTGGRNAYIKVQQQKESMSWGDRHTKRCTAHAHKALPAWCSGLCLQLNNSRWRIRIHSWTRDPLTIFSFYFKFKLKLHCECVALKLKYLSFENDRFWVQPVLLHICIFTISLVLHICVHITHYTSCLLFRPKPLHMYMCKQIMHVKWCTKHNITWVQMKLLHA